MLWTPLIQIINFFTIGFKLKEQYTVYEAISVFVYAQVYILYYYVTNTEMAKSNVRVLLGSERESESNDSAEVK